MKPSKVPSNFLICGMRLEKGISLSRWKTEKGPAHYNGGRAFCVLAENNRYAAGDRKYKGQKTGIRGQSVTRGNVPLSMEDCGLVWNKLTCDSLLYTK